MLPALRPLLSAARGRARRAPLPCLRRGLAVSASDLVFGQPVYETHPHLLQAGESTLLLQLLQFGLNTWLIWRCSNPRHHSSRICPSPHEACQILTSQFYRHTRGLRSEIPLRRRILQISPRPRLPILDRYELSSTLLWTQLSWGRFQ